jgi:hypothetical protein
VEKRECEGVVPRIEDLRRPSGVAFAARMMLEAVMVNVPDDGRDSSVLSVILLKRTRGSRGCWIGERGEKVGKETKDGDPV